MSVDRTTPTVGPITGLAYMAAVAEEIAALWNRTPVPLGSVAGTNTITAAASPTLVAYAAGQFYSLTPANTITGAATLNIDSVGAKNLYDAAGDALPAGGLVAGRDYLVRDDGTQFRVIGEPSGEIFKYLSADDTGGQNANTAQPWFPTAGAVTVPGSRSYFFEGLLRLSRSAGSTNHTTGILFGGTATLNSIDYLGMAKEGDANDLQDVSAFWATAATSLVLKAASTSTTEQSMFRVQGVVRINAGGTFIPQFIYSAAPGGTPTVLRGSYFRMTPMPDNAVFSKGAWA